jgi:hypothetical protein
VGFGFLGLGLSGRLGLGLGLGLGLDMIENSIQYDVLVAYSSRQLASK